MDVLHMFSTAKPGDSHINRLQSIQCLIVIQCQDSVEQLSWVVALILKMYV